MYSYEPVLVGCLGGLPAPLALLGLAHVVTSLSSQHQAHRFQQPGRLRSHHHLRRNVFVRQRCFENSNYLGFRRRQLQGCNGGLGVREQGGERPTCVRLACSQQGGDRVGAVLVSPAPACVRGRWGG